MAGSLDLDVTVNRPPTLPIVQAHPPLDLADLIMETCPDSDVLADRAQQRLQRKGSGKVG
jgi:hypothetical protein